MPLPELIAALSKPAIYPEPAGDVRVIQTQMSVVFLAGDYAYKIKQPVNLGYVDYTTLSARRSFCERELELNRRLCPGAYLGVVPITSSGSIPEIDGTGEIIEYAVKMRRLPDEQLLDKLLKRGLVTYDMMSQVAAKVAGFHLEAKTNADIAAFGSVEAVRRNTEENFSQTEKYFDRSISQAIFEKIRAYTRTFLAENTRLFEARAAAGKIRDCHGDLHAQHICFCHDLCIYDCIEFNDRFRYGDTASEAAFLAMDLERSGHADLARAFVKEYAARSRDEELSRLLNFYKCYRAYVRGKVNSFKLDDPYVSAEDSRQSAETARGYFDLAASYTRARPALVVMNGFVGSGKTTVAKELAGRLGAVYASSDVTRKQLAGISLTERKYEEPGGGIYSADYTRRTYEALYNNAREALADGASVILDAAFLKSAERETARRIAGEAGADFYIIECRAGEEAISARLEARRGRPSISDGRWEIYLKQKGWSEPVTEGETGRILVDTSLPLAQNVRQILDCING
jgi:aminoglycoside phosphotransferase family enzyme/predicted kinase